jgi:hypothetical protein
MKYGLDINPAQPKPRRRAGLRLARRADPSSRPGHHPLPQGDRVPDPRQRRGVQLRRQPVRLLPPEHRDRQRHGRLSHRRADRRTGAGDGRQAVLQAVQAQRRQRTQHGHRLQRPRPWRARSGGVLQPLPTKLPPNSNPAISTGMLSSPAECAGSTAGASSRRCPKRPAKSSSRG